MAGNTTIRTLKARYEEAVKRGDRIDRKHKSLPSIVGMGEKNPSHGIDGVFLTQKASVRNQARKEVDDLENLLTSATQSSQSTLLLKKRKEMKEVDDALELMKKDYERRMDACEDRRLQFELKQAKLREQVLKFEKFIQENDSKRQRAECKAKHERKLYEEKCREITNVTLLIQDLEKSSQSNQKELLKQRRYEEFLERIIEHGDFGYEEFADILNRYKTLVGANDDLMIQSAQREKELDELRRRVNGLKIEKQNQMLVGNSSIHEYQNQLEVIRSAVKQGEEEKYHLEDRQKDISKELSQVTLAVKNIYNRCLASMSSTRSTLLNSTINTTSFSSSSASSTGSAVQSTTMNKNLVILSEKLDQNLAVMHARMIDFIDFLKEYPDSGFAMQSSILTSASNSSGSAIGGGYASNASMMVRQASTSSGVFKDASVSSSGYLPLTSKIL